MQKVNNENHAAETKYGSVEVGATFEFLTSTLNNRLYAGTK